MAKTHKMVAQQPLILRAHRLMEAFTKSDDEREFYLDSLEGFILYIDLDKPQSELDALAKELANHPERYLLIPKLTFYETKKIMENFVNEKLYDIDIKEKLSDIIQAKEARSNFLEFLIDHHAEQDKWQQYYQERSRIRIIEWLRNNHFNFVFEEDLDLPKELIERLKQNLFENKVGKDIVNGRKAIITKAASYYSNEALHPRPKRGRPPKQAVKQEVEQQISLDIYTMVPDVARPFLFTPDISSAGALSFSADFIDYSQQGKKHSSLGTSSTEREDIQQKLAELRAISSRWLESESPKKQKPPLDFDELDEDEEDEDFEEEDFEDEYFEEDEFEEPPPTKKSSKKQSAAQSHPPVLKKDATSGKQTTTIAKKKGTPAAEQSSKWKRIIPSQKQKPTLKKIKVPKK